LNEDDLLLSVVSGSREERKALDRAAYIVLYSQVELFCNVRPTVL